MALESNEPSRKHAYSNILNILQPKNDNFQIKNSDIFFYISTHRGGSNESPQATFMYS